MDQWTTVEASAAVSRLDRATAVTVTPRMSCDLAMMGVSLLCRSPTDGRESMRRLPHAEA
jgi:hypothetical protein